ncbi:alpha/beta fold hydrolase [Desulfosediminicola sp.]|uniref:alpha/beta fold hydrolase n=1 Tax=Desulfosediminicola sp. TaxID=2886825 RepID=UPI003AF249F6
MNRSAYLTTGLAIKALSNLTKADVALHDIENIPDAPTIFVINHFTRLETVLLPYHIYKLTNLPVWSLAHSGLFQGGLRTFLDMVGAVSTDDPKRDELIVRSLLTGEAHWIIFPEGSMLKTKQITHGGKYMLTSATGVRKPHTGAAALALRSELFRQFLWQKAEDKEDDSMELLNFFNLESIHQVRKATTHIVPVNVTYYPIRARENLLSSLASKMVRDISERTVEEIMTEGTMLLSGVDIDVRFGKAIAISEYLGNGRIKRELAKEKIDGFLLSPELKSRMRELSEKIMQRYMGDIYSLTTVNHEHLFASVLRRYPQAKIPELELRQRVFLMANRIGEMKNCEKCLHSTLQGSQSHLLTDDRYSSYENFLKLAVDKGVLVRDGEMLYQDRTRLTTPISFHRGRIDNPIEVMANELEPLEWLSGPLNYHALQPASMLRFNIARYLLARDRRRFEEDYHAYGYGDDLERKSFGKPFLLPSWRGWRRKLGVVLIHSYMSSPEEMRSLGNHLRREGLWVYVVRLPGHGTSSRDLAIRSCDEWTEAVEDAYVLMSTICEKVVFCGISLGAGLALDVAGRAPAAAGVVAICPPLKLSDYSTNFMPAIDVWNRMVTRVRGTSTDPYFEFVADNPHIAYRRNPFTGIREVGRFLVKMEDILRAVRVPSFVLHTEQDPVVSKKAGRNVYKKLRVENKQFTVFNLKRHIIINGEGADLVHRNISDFINQLSRPQSP